MDIYYCNFNCGLVTKNEWAYFSEFFGVLCVCMYALRMRDVTFFNKDESMTTQSFLVTQCFYYPWFTLWMQLLQEGLICCHWLGPDLLDDTAKNAQVVPGWWEQASTMLCCTPWTLLSTMLLHLVMLNNVATCCWQHCSWGAAQHCCKACFHQPGTGWAFLRV